MFEESDEILVWATKRRKYNVYKLKLEATAKNKLIDLFNQGINKFMFDDKNEELSLIDFTATYKLSEDECFKIDEFILPKEIKDAIDFSDTLDAFLPLNSGCNKEGFSIKAILVGNKDEKNNYCVAGQNFSKTQILYRKKLNFILMGDTFKEEENKFCIAASDVIDCLFFEDRLIFMEYFKANKVFDLSSYYRAATAEEVIKFRDSNMFFIPNNEEFGKNVVNVGMRKKIARILDMGMLDQTDSKNVKDKADELNIELTLNVDDKIVMPLEKKELKVLLAFLAEELYKGTFSQKTYFSNSNREVVE